MKIIVYYCILRTTFKRKKTLRGHKEISAK